VGLSDAVARMLRRKQASVISAHGSGSPTDVPLYTTFSADQVLGMTPAQLWRTQPHLRTVINFLARNVAQLGLHTFERVSDTDRARRRDTAIARLFARPNPATTAFELIYTLVADLALYDDAFWHLSEDIDSPSGWRITPIPPEWVRGMRGGTIFGPDQWLIEVHSTVGGITETVPVPAEQIKHFKGWNPDEPRLGSSPVESIKQILAEQMHARAYRQQVWQRGGRVGAVITRPAGVPWSDTARERFSADWRAKWSGDDGPKAGGTPILEDGMSLNRIGFSANEEQFVEAAKLSLSEVAGVYHVNPTMVGVLDNANYSNVREFRKMLYGDTLGPTLAMIEDRINTFLVPRIEPRRNELYVEFNINEKLQGSFEEQSQAIQTAVGRPWMTADEARAKLNMPSLGGDADALVTPLNVLVGGQASPTDSGEQNRASVLAPSSKARAPQPYEDKHVEQLARFFRRQANVVKSQLGAKADGDWWDATRWNAELADELFALAADVSRQVSSTTLDELGFDAQSYDFDRTTKFLRTVAENDASSINEHTRAQIVAALDDDEPQAAVSNVFAVAAGARAAQIATTSVTAASGFGTTEAAKQAAGGRARKTWITGANPRKSHAAMNGETVGIEEQFSNGLDWPGAMGDPDEVAGCNCSVQISVA